MSQRNWRKSWPKQYSVGYKKPPVHTRFRAGQSGNSRGRPRARKGPKELFQNALFAVGIIKEGGVEKRMSCLAIAYKALVASALKGNPRSMTLMFNLMHQYEMLDDLDKETKEMLIKFV